MCAAALGAARARRGSRRLPAADYLIAAAAAERGFGVLHLDAHYDTLASMMNYASPAGSRLIAAGGELLEAVPSTSMHAVPSPDVRELVETILRTGLMLGHVFGDLLENLPADAFEDEDPGDVLLDMFAGTIAPVAGAAGRQAVRQATALLGAVADRTISDLQAAAQLAAEGEG